MDDIKKFFGAKVKEKRRNMRINQEQFGQLLNLTRASVINIETGRHSPTLTDFFLICRILKSKPNDLLPNPTSVKIKETVVSRRRVVIKKKIKLSIIK